MSDIVEQLRNWRSVHLARLHLLMEEAADEMERLSRTGSNDAKTGDDATECPSQGANVPERERLRLTAEDREALHWFAHYGLPQHHSATLRGLLERLGGER